MVNGTADHRETRPRIERARSVYLVDDDEATCKLIRTLLDQVDLEVHVFHSAEQFLGAFRPENPGCLLLDLRMPGMSGVQLQQRLSEQGSRLPIIFLSGYGDVPTATTTIREGAVDFIQKPFSSSVLIERIEEALDRDHRQRLEEAERQDLSDAFAKLTDREQEIVDLVAGGMTNREVAAKLGVSSQAIDARRSNAFRKLGIASVPELVRIVLRARDLGVLAPR